MMRHFAQLSRITIGRRHLKFHRVLSIIYQMLRREPAGGVLREKFPINFHSHFAISLFYVPYLFLRARRESIGGVRKFMNARFQHIAKSSPIISQSQSSTAVINHSHETREQALISHQPPKLTQARYERQISGVDKSKHTFLCQTKQRKFSSPSR